MMKITGLSHLFKWENLHNWWLTKYFFAPLYVFFFFLTPVTIILHGVWQCLAFCLFVWPAIISLSISIDQYSVAIFPYTFLSGCIHHNIFLLLYFCYISTTVLLTHTPLSASSWHVMVALVVFLPLHFLY